jgi:SNF2 family DNA or RNA helicase
MGKVAGQPATTALEPDADAVDDVARAMVAAGRVVPGLTVEADGRSRSWWWPLPAASHRSLVAGLVVDPSADGQRRAAARLAEAVDATVRERLVNDNVVLVPRRGGRPAVADAWARSLVSADPWLPPSLDPAKVRALADAVTTWVRSGAVIEGRVRLCLRVREPARGDAWTVELLAQDRDEPSLVLPLADAWAGRSPFGPSALEDVLASLGRMVRLAPELGAVLDEAAPTDLVLDGSSVLRLVRERVGALDDAGIGVLLPSWWSHRPRLGLRARATKSSPGAAGAAGGLGIDAIVDFRWEAALGEQRLTKADLAALARAVDAKRSLVRLRGQWVEIDPARVGALLQSIGTIDRAAAGDLLRAGMGLDQLGTADEVEVVGVDASAVPWLSSLLNDAIHATVEPVATPEDFDGELRPYQERGAGWLTFLGRLGLGACLADDMGLGKTAQLIATLLADPVQGPTLVVCPVSVLGNWERELSRFAPSLDVHTHHGPDRHGGDRSGFAGTAAAHDVVLTTYSLVTRDVAELAAVDWGRLVLDEAQQIKNPGAAQTKAVRQLRARRRIALTGTPVENRLSELWSIMQVLNPGLLGSARSFRERFALPIERDHDADATELLRRATGPFVLRRLKTDRSIISDLPDKIETVDRCPLTREQATLYQAVVDDLLAAADEAEGIDRRALVLAGLLRLKQVCNHPAHFQADGSPLRGRSGKLTRTEELLEEILGEGDKVLCFTQFRAWGELLVPYLQRRFGTEALWLHGGVRRPARDEMVRRFEDPQGPQLFLVSLKAGGTGLNLTAASHVIHLDRWWNPAVEDQATDRAYRIGQRRTVQVHKLVTLGTVEERIDEMITRKRDLAQRVVGTGEAWLTELSTDELRDLVALRAGDVD